VNRTAIEWTDLTWNPITGCEHGCPYCYARRMAYRLRGRFGYPEDEPFRPTFHENRLTEPLKLKKPSKIFTCSMGEMFGAWIPYVWVNRIMLTIWTCHRWKYGHTFQVLTKSPQNIPAFITQFPPNLWIGTSVESHKSEWRIKFITDKTLRKDGLEIAFASFEPLHGPVNVDENLDWVIVGAETGNRADRIEPKPEWISKVLKDAEKFGIPVFMKDNIKPYWDGEIIREFPQRR